MKALRLAAIGGPQNLRIEDIPTPEPDDGDVLVRITAAALNRRDVFITQGLYPGVELPRTLGSDGAGTIDGAGDAVVVDPMLGWGDDDAAWAADSSILGMPRDGTFAQYVRVPRENVFPKPKHLSMEQAAALPLAGLTAYRALVTRGELVRGETVLIPGVGGGVQTFVLLFAKALGARTIVTSGSDEKLARAKELGADLAFNYVTTPDWNKQIPRGDVDLVVDSSGGDTLARAVSVVRPGGRLVIYGGTRGESSLKLFPIFWNHLDIRGTSMGSRRDFELMLRLVEQRQIVPIVDRVYDLTDAVAGAQRLLENEQFGKIVLRVA